MPYSQHCNTLVFKLVKSANCGDNRKHTTKLIANSNDCYPIPSGHTHIIIIGDVNI
jgi:hypothetical protein